MGAAGARASLSLYRRRGELQFRFTQSAYTVSNIRVQADVATTVLDEEHKLEGGTGAQPCLSLEAPCIPENTTKDNPLFLLWKELDMWNERSGGDVKCCNPKRDKGYAVSRMAASFYGDATQKKRRMYWK